MNINLDFSQDFPILNRCVYGKRLAYLDNGATSLTPLCVVKSIRDYYELETANVHRGIHYLSEKATEKYEKVRDTVASFINAHSRDEIIFTSGTTMGLNLLSLSLRKNFSKGDEIIITEMEHHANIVPWQMAVEEKGIVLKIVPVDDQGNLDYEKFKELLNEKTKVISITHISNVLGTINDIEKINTLRKKSNAILILDCAQSIAHGKIDVQKLDADFVVFSAHKMLGPTGVGIVYGKKTLLDQMTPVFGGGDMIDEVTFDKTTYHDTPYKFEAGTPNIAGVMGLGSAIDYWMKLDFKAISNHEKDLYQKTVKRLNSIDELTIIGNVNHKIPIFSFLIQNIHPHDMSTVLDREGVAVRAGHHCAQPLMSRYQVSALTRASFAFYNSEEDVEQLYKAIKKSILFFK